MTTDDDVRDPQMYEMWSEEDIRKHIRMLKTELDRRQGYPPLATRGLIQSLLNPEGPDFLGTGLTLAEFMIAGQIRRAQMSITLQPPFERKRRMRLILEMSAEVMQIREKTKFCVGLAESAISAVIEGDWKLLEEWAKHFTFEEEGPETVAQYAPIYAKFRELCLEALRTRPLEDLPPQEETQH